jgi:hypothetical protein
MEALPRYRYAAHDEYALQEMILRYQSASPQERIVLLSGWQEQSTLPFKLARLAVEDPDAGVRYWMARNARALDYREWNSPARKRDDAHPERNLEARLRADLVPVVRAAVFENACLHRPGSLNIEDDLRAMSRLERLAYMRNPGILVFEAQAVLGLELPLQERQELILALLTNQRFVEGSRSPHISWTSFRELWDTIGRFPDGDAKLDFFRRIYAPGNKRAATFQAAPGEAVRCAILEGCDEKDDDAAGLLELGTADSHPDCRKLAYSKLPVGTVQGKLREVLKSSDEAAILGLLSNRNVTADQLQAIWRRVRELNLTEEARQLRRERTAADIALELSEEWRSPGTLARSRAFAWDVLCGLVVPALGVTVLIAARQGQGALLSLLIIACCGLLWLPLWLPYHFSVAEFLATQRLNDIKRLLGAKDVTESEAKEEADAAHLRYSARRNLIRGLFLAATCLVALVGLIVALLQ